MSFGRAKECSCAETLSAARCAALREVDDKEIAERIANEVFKLILAMKCPKGWGTMGQRVSVGTLCTFV